MVRSVSLICLIMTELFYLVRPFPEPRQIVLLIGLRIVMTPSMDRVNSKHMLCMSLHW